MVCSGLYRIRRTGTAFLVVCRVYGGMVLFISWAVECIEDWYLLGRPVLGLWRIL